MTTEEKKIRLRKHKALATGLFILMAVTYIVMVILKHNNHTAWIGFVEAFSEAAMVGALADWFAVTALFHYPMGLKIPHTNLIQKSKDRIGDSLGSFVVDNFLNGQNIRPYIQKLTVSNIAANWLQKEKNIQSLTNETTRIANDLLMNTDDDYVANVISRKGKSLLDNIDISAMLAQLLQYFREKNEQEKIIDKLLQKIKEYVHNNEDTVRERVRKESHILIPGFVDNIIANKIISGANKYINEIQNDKQHRLRLELERNLISFEEDLRSGKKWNEQIEKIKTEFLSGSKVDGYAKDIWLNIKNTILTDLHSDNSGIKRYLKKSVNDFAVKLNDDAELRNKMDKWIRYTAYNYVLRNSRKAGDLISNTVENWEGKELSEKLELEVGKDLQFIRINGTLVGGLVGLIIHTLTILLS